MQGKSAAIILAAGLGSRLMPLTDAKPKSLIEVNGKALLEQNLRGYIRASAKFSNSLSDIFIITGYKYQMIEDFVRDFVGEYREKKEAFKNNACSINFNDENLVPPPHYNAHF